MSPAWQWIEFRLYDGDVLLDKERVPVLADGVAPIYLDLANQNISVRADEYGEPYSLPITTQAVLYNGNIPITAADFKANLAAKNIVYYPGNIFDPMLDGLYPVRAVQWSISQGTIDQNGIITVSALPEDKAEIEVSALYDDVKYTATLTLNKVKDGEAPVTIDIENENTSIACDSYGAPYPGELPLVTRAIFYKGTRQENPFWFLNTAISGVSIAQDGTLTVAVGAGLGRANNVLVCAAYRGKTYTRMFTIAKALEGFAATVYKLLPSVNKVVRDAEGNNEPPTVSCGQEKIVGNNSPEPSDKTLVYTTSSSSTSIPYTGPVTVGTLRWIQFLLYERENFTDGDTPLDSERVSVLSDGKDGIKGEDGYIWIRYADNAQGEGMSNNPDGKDYIGLAYNKLIAEESNNPADYQWALFKGEDGVSLYTWLKYSDNADGTGLYNTPTENTKYIGIAINKSTPDESDNKADYVWSLFKGANGVKGDNGYIWMRYADNAQGGGMSNDPAGKDYIGLAYNKLTAEESDNPADYQWALFKGEDGATFYTWLKFSDNADGTGLYDTPTANTKYIGIATNKDTQTESDNKADYIWSLFKGLDSIGIFFEESNITIHADAYGVPYPESLPLVIHAKLETAETTLNPAWSLESPPGGVTIGSDGKITVAANAALADQNVIRVRAVFEGVTYTSTLMIGKTLDGKSPITLNLLPDNEVIQADYLGNPTQGLPFTAQAILKEGDDEITAAMELADAAKVEIIRYPGNIFDPMLDGFYPTLGYPVAWSLVNAPAGVTIDSRGLVTVSATAQLGDTNDITIRAVYHGKAHNAVLGVIKVKGGRPAVTYYTWIMFSDYADGTGLYNAPTANTKYIGIAANKLTRTESTNKADYTWSLFKGADGIKGEDGYIWIRYADNAQGGGISNNPDGKDYIGLAYNKTTATESDNPADYMWALYKGTDGVDGETPIILSLLPGNAVIQADYLGNPIQGLPFTAQAILKEGDDEITAAMELAEAAKVEIIQYPGNIFDPMLGDLYPTLGYPVVWSLIGAPAGVTIDRHGLITVPLTANLSDTNKITVRATYHGEEHYAILGVTKVRGGRPAVTYYTWIMFSDYADGTGLYNTPTANTKYIGIATNKLTRTESTNKADYTWSLFKGADGIKGEDGYIWMRYADNAQGSGMSDSPEGKYYVGYAYNKETETESDNPADYVWGRFKGDNANAPDSRGVTYTADTGNTGKVVISGVPMTMNDLDWVLFMGEADWTKARLYQWHEKERVWTMLAPADNPLKYMEALKDIAREDAPDGIFSNVFCQVLFAQQAAIDTLMTKVMTLLEGGVIQSQEYELGSKGFRIESNGNANFNNVNIAGNSIFSGDIISGPLTLLNETPEGAESIYPIGTNSDFIIILNNSAPVAGEYGEGRKIVRIWKENYGNSFWPPSSTQENIAYSDVYVYFEDGTQERITRRKTRYYYASISNPQKLTEVTYLETTSQILEFRYVTSGKTLRLNISEIPTASGSGIVYRKGNDLKIG